jgi:hypothetical protein
MSDPPRFVLTISGLQSTNVPDLPKGVTYVKRSTGCTEINNTTYESAGGTFELFCDTRWPSNYFLYVTFTLDYITCMEECVTWNTQMTEKCVGVRWQFGTYGPRGLPGGSECIFNWIMPDGASVQASGEDSARLQNQVSGLMTVLRIC